MVTKMHLERAKAIALENEKELSRGKGSTKSDLDKSIDRSRARTPGSVYDHVIGILIFFLFLVQEIENTDANIFDKTAVFTQSTHQKRRSHISQKPDLDKSMNLPALNVSMEESELIGYQTVNIRQNNKIKSLKAKCLQLTEALDGVPKIKLNVKILDSTKASKGN